MEGSPKSTIKTIIGLSDQKADETLKNQNLTKKLLSIAEEAKNKPEFAPQPEIGKLLYSIAATTPEAIWDKRALLVDYVVNNKIKSQAQLEAGINHLKTNPEPQTQEFEEACGVGVEVTEEQIQEAVNQTLEADKDKILEAGWESKGLPGTMMGKVRQQLKWANPSLVKKHVDVKLVELLGEPPAQQPKKKQTKQTKQAKPKLVEEKKREKLSTCIGRELKSAKNPPELLQKHLEATGGKVMTRFPPEPNGYLHIGHAKAMRFSFTMAAENEGSCYLRFDDTNPEKESEEYIQSIIDNVKWLGYTPWKITHASEYFGDIFELAKELIRRGKAYVDEQPGEEIKEQRKSCQESPFRNTSPEENLRKFELMSKGYYSEGEACLRMKIDMKHANPCMRDPVAYRIKFSPHPHVGDDWCVYPTYDMEHCIVDSLENITHSLCTLEFEIRRDSYYWLLEALDLYRPSVWEYSRLNITNMVMSKRKLQKLVEENWVKGWGDPRMPTIFGMRRRGYTPKAINDFVDEIGVTRRGNENVISLKLLEHYVRKDLDETALRTLAVLDPLLVEISNLDSSVVVEAPLFPKNPENGKRSLTVHKNIYIEKSDFLEADKPNYFGLAPGKIVGLKYVPFKLKCVSFKKSSNGEVEKVLCEAVYEDIKPKGVLHWLSAEEAIPCETRLYDVLFKSENPSELPNWLDDFNHESLKVLENSLLHKDMAQVQELDRFQFERLGYFVVDKDSSAEKKVVNRIITLTETKKKAIA